MAQKTQVILSDDLDGSTDDVQTYTFGLQGTTYEIELSKGNADALFKALQPYQDAARKVGGSRGRSRSTGAASGRRNDLAKVREWARANGYTVSDRGRLPADVEAAYDKAN